MNLHQVQKPVQWRDSTGQNWTIAAGAITNAHILNILHYPWTPALLTPERNVMLAAVRDEAKRRGLIR